MDFQNKIKFVLFLVLAYVFKGLIKFGTKFSSARLPGSRAE